MIMEIQVDSFGKFSGSRFSLSGVTVFAGKNEAGKTTLFDAFLEGLCRPGAAKKTGKLLKERYGTDRKVVLMYMDKEFYFEENEFLNLYAIRAGGINLDFSTSVWMEKIKAQLFTGGIDPLKLKQHFINLASDRGSLKHNKEYNRLSMEIIRENERLEELISRREEALRLFKSGEVDKQRELKKIIDKAAGQLRVLKARLEEDRLSREKQKILEAMTILNEEKQCKKKAMTLAVFKNPEPGKLDRIETTLQEKDKQLILSKEKLRSLYNTLEEIGHEIDDAASCRQKQKICIDAASCFLKKIMEYSEESPCAKKIKWNRMCFFIAVIFLLGGVLSLFFFRQFPLRYIIPGIAMTGALPVFFTAGKVIFKKDESRMNEFVSNIKKQWKEINGFLLTAENPGELTGELYKIKNDARSMVKRYYELEEKKLTISRQAARFKREVIEKESLYHSLLKERTQWLEKRNLKSRDEYIRKASEYKRLTRELLDLEPVIHKLLHSYRLADRQKLNMYLTKKLEELCRRGDPPAPLTEQEFLRLRKLSDKIEKHILKYQKRYDIINIENAGKRGRLAESLGSLSGEIVIIEKNIAEKKRIIERHLFRKEAATLAGDIFDEMARDSGTGMQNLSKELAARFGNILPGISTTEIIELHTGNIFMADKSGEKRAIKHLSGGTRDSFFLAARLLLARKTNSTKEGILIFDDPFLSLDCSKLEACLEMIKHFQRETNWQLIFLTKDEFLVKLINDLFDNVKVYDLSKK